MHYIKEAIDLAVENVKSGRGGPFGALVVKDNKIIARGTNQVTSINDPTAHAEIVAIRNACKFLNTYQLAGCEFYSSCEPCPMCLGAIYWARPDALFFGAKKEMASNVEFDDSLIYKEIILPLNKRKISTRYIKNKYSNIPFKAWEDKHNKVEY